MKQFLAVFAIIFAISTVEAGLIGGYNTERIFGNNLGYNPAYGSSGLGLQLGLPSIGLGHGQNAGYNQLSSAYPGGVFGGGYNGGFNGGYNGGYNTGFGSGFNTGYRPTFGTGFRPNQGYLPPSIIGGGGFSGIDTTYGSNGGYVYGRKRV